MSHRNQLYNNKKGDQWLLTVGRPFIFRDEQMLGDHLLLGNGFQPGMLFEQAQDLARLGMTLGVQLAVNQRITTVTSNLPPSEGTNTSSLI